MTYSFSNKIDCDVILFEQGDITNYEFPEVIFRSRKVDDQIFGDAEESLGDYVLEKEGKIIAIGGFLLHYNMPFADVFMEVDEMFKNQGYGRFLVQELKKACYLSGRIPAARCDKTNLASKATLLKAGFKIAGYMICGKITT